MIDHNKKLICIHIARTGGTSIEYALCGDDWWNIEPETKHLSGKQTREFYGEEIWNSYTKFSVVRNPWDRLVSMWSTGWWHQADLTKDVSLNDFIKLIKPHQHETYNSIYYNQILNEDLNFILRFETLQHDFSSMLQNIGLRDIVLPHYEMRHHKNYREMFDKKNELLVGEMFKMDILKYGYKF